jgi:hypothetical protein
MKRRDDSRMYRRVLAAHTSMLGARVLLDLANVADTDFAHFRRRYLIFPLGDDDTGLRKYRDELREVWRLRLGYHRILDDWTRRHQVSPSEWSIPLWVGERGIVEPNPTHLGLLLTMAIRDNAEGLGFCPNPNCPHPYFLRDRKNQSVCDRPACAKFKKNESGRTWWSDHGPAWRAKNRAKASRKRNRRT